MASLVSSLIAFCVAAALLTITPGLDTALVLRTAASEGRWAAFAAGLGICMGCLIWAAVVALGLGAVLAASELGYAALKWVGASYLVWVGIQLIRRPGGRATAPIGECTRRGTPAWLARGFLTNILNPKVGVFYVSFLPQFVPAGAPVGPMVVALGAIHALMGLAWFAFLIGATHRVATALRGPRVVAALDRMTGVVFVGFGVRLAFEARR